jgi:hypothetical protein
MSTAGNEYVLSIRLNVTNLGEVRDAIRNLGAGVGGGSGGSGGGGAEGGSRFGTNSVNYGTSAAFGSGDDEGGGGGRKTRSRSKKNNAPEMVTAFDVTGGGSASGNVSLPYTVDIGANRAPHNRGLMLPGPDEATYGFRGIGPGAPGSRFSSSVDQYDVAGDPRGTYGVSGPHPGMRYQKPGTTYGDAQARRQLSQGYMLAGEDAGTYGVADPAGGSRYVNPRSTYAGRAMPTIAGHHPIPGQFAGQFTKPPPFTPSRPMSPAMQSFLGRPNAMGLYFSAVFGGWEVAQAGRQAGLSSVAGLGATSPADYMQAQVQSATAGFGGPLAGMASLPMDLFGNGPTSVAVNAAGTAGVYNSQTALMQSRMMRGQAGRRNSIGGDTTTAAYAFANRNVAIASSLESAGFSNRETRATASLMMAGGERLPTMMNDFLASVAGAATGSATIGQVIGGLGGTIANPAFATGKNMAAQAKADLETAKLNAENERRILRDDFASYRRGLANSERLRSSNAAELAGTSPFNSVSDNERSAISGLRARRSVERGDIVRNSTMLGFNGMAFGGDATVRGFDQETAAMIGSITRSANFERRGFVLGNEASSQRTFGINRSTELAMSGRPLQAQISSINANRNAASAMVGTLPEESRASAYEEIRASAESQIELARFEFGKNRYNIRRSQLTSSRQLSAMEGRYAYAAGALGISGAAVQAASGLRSIGMGAEADATLGLASRAIGLERRNYIEAFRGEQFDVRNIGISSRDQENVGATLGGIDSAMKEVAAATKDSADKIIQAIKDLVSN